VDDRRSAGFARQLSLFQNAAKHASIGIMPIHLIAIDQGTTSTRAIVFDGNLSPVAVAQQELRQIYPAPGWVEHDPEEIWSAVVATVREASPTSAKPRSSGIG
jgi:glycerol kinase